MNEQLLTDKLFIASTDTVVGIGGPVTPEVRRALNKLKGRDENKQIAIIVDSVLTAKKIAHKYWNAHCDALASEHWPGAVTLIISDEIALRVPDCDPLREFVSKNGPMYMTSANLTGEKPLTLEESIVTFAQIKHHYNFCQNTSGRASVLLDVRTMKKIVR